METYTGKERGWLWWPEDILACYPGLGVAPGWVEVMDVVSIHMGIFVAAVLCA